MTTNRELLNNLYKTLTLPQNEEEMRLLLEDLCTTNEIEQMAQRIEAARLLTEGKTYQQVKDTIEIASATLSRVSGALKHGEGYKKFI